MTDQPNEPTPSGAAPQPAADEAKPRLASPAVKIRQLNTIRKKGFT